MSVGLTYAGLDPRMKAAPSIDQRDPAANTCLMKPSHLSTLPATGARRWQWKAADFIE